MAGANTLTDDVDIDMAGLIGQVWKNKWLILIVTAVAGALLYVTLLQVDPRYRSSARIIIEKRESVFTRRSDGDIATADNRFDEQGIGSQVQVLASDDLALAVIDKLDLVQSPEFRRSASPSITEDVKALVGADDGDASGTSTAQERVLRKFRDRLTVFSPEKSRVIVIEFWAKDPKLAQQVPNALADAYIAFNRDAKLEVSQEATGWLGSEIDELRAKVRESEAKVAEFRSSSDILVGNNNALLATQQLSETSSELSRVRGERSAAVAKAASVRSALQAGGSIDVIPEVISSPLIQRLRERQVALQAQISELETTLLPNHPRLKALKSQLGDFDGQIRGAARNILTSLENNADLLAQQEAALLQEVNRLKAEAGRVGEAEVELRALEREAAAQRELLQSYLAQFREAASRQNSEYLPVDARIISRAVLPSKSYFPKVVPFTIAGTLAVLVLMIVAVLTWALMSGKAFKPAGRVSASMVPERIAADHATTHGAREPDDPPRPANAPPPLAPPMHAEPAAGVDRPASAVGPERFQLGHAIQAIADMGSATVAVVSPGGDPGSRATWQLARHLAGQGRSVLVVDLTGSGITGREMLGRDDLPGLRELLSGELGFERAIFLDRLSQVHVLPAGNDDHSGGVPLEELAPLCRAIAASYDYLVMDCGPAGPAGLDCIGDHDMLVLVSQAGIDDAAAAVAERDLLNRGYGETIVVADEPADGRAMETAA